MSCIALAAFLLLGKAVTHSLDVASLVVSVSAVVAGTALAAAIAFVSFRSVRRRRALVGGCLACRFKCQHAMTEAHPTRMWLVNSVDRAASGQIRPVTGCGPAHGAERRPAEPAPLAPLAEPARHPVPLPMPHWPDRPLRAEAPVSLPVRVPPPREPAGQREQVPARGH